MTEPKTPSQPVTPNGWGVACWLCGHPATYHGMTFCQVRAGASNKRACDCTGYTASAPVPANPPSTAGGETP